MHAKKNWRNRYRRFANQLRFLLCKLRQVLAGHRRSGYTLINDRLYTLKPSIRTIIDQVNQTSKAQVLTEIPKP